MAERSKAPDSRCQDGRAVQGARLKFEIIALTRGCGVHGVNNPALRSVQKFCHEFEPSSRLEGIMEFHRQVAPSRTVTCALSSNPSMGGGRFTNSVVEPETQQILNPRSIAMRGTA
ncbi:hypothetical protein RRG08_029198 [Elysia crispata]|uniref:Uncharacterized protein n=1 Tax=Elysia crispata TaxID=231223 RepID=A0AAE1AJF3_9GAST|nr:hypothetical protein RRG08_029198 [Elysia crispata]